MANYILIDGSYYCFYRYYAIKSWFRNAHKDVELDNPIENEIFVEKYKKTFVSKIKELSKKLKIKDPKIIVGKDCKRKKYGEWICMKNIKKTEIKMIVLWEVHL